MRDNLLSMGLLQFKPWVRLERKGTYYDDVPVLSRVFDKRLEKRGVSNGL